ncbi:hypothetical protein H9L15_08600 [Sphingomonas daechungensis]|uniref:DUF3606 domain-containing protein n=1 Tax=Sphingomonas daechungensis TaxID=1176646 RepID=A0ABX6T3Z3_9SPHN|nr:hypothetical protein H9L15_08600 [Sphingomonas daechungensis]
MTGHSTRAGAATAPESSEDDLRRYGISTEERVSYLWNGYRYSNAGDAIAAAKRAAR